jgi:tetratricopeptide (TPR) repeat protein
MGNESSKPADVHAPGGGPLAAGGPVAPVVAAVVVAKTDQSQGQRNRNVSLLNAKVGDVQGGDASTAATGATAPAAAAAVPSPAKPSRQDVDNFDYKRLRDDLMAFSLGEAAFQYAERLNRETPNNPPVMALLAETAYLYEKSKNKGRREHWVDRCDVLQRGIDVARKCMHEHPDYGPCYRTYVLCACKMSDTEVWFKRWKPLSLFKHYNRIQAIGDRALELSPTSDVALGLAAIAGRCGTRLRHWYSPWHAAARYYQLPYQRDILLRSKALLERAHELDPRSVEIACRLGETLYELGDMNESRRWYTKVRDEMNAEDQRDSIWQTVAHTHLCSHFERPEWNIPFG